MKSCSIYIQCVVGHTLICCYGCGTQVTIPTAKTFHFIAQTRDLKYFSQTCSTAGMVWVFTWLVVATGMGFHMTCSTCIDSRVTCSVAFYKASTTQVRQFSSTQYHGKFTMQHLSLYTFHDEFTYSAIQYKYYVRPLRRIQLYMKACKSIC